MAQIKLNATYGLTGTLQTANIHADAINDTKIADDVIGTEHFTAGEVDQTAIANQAINEAKIQISNAPTNGYMLTAQSGNTGGLTWAAASSNAPYFLARRSNTGQTVANDTYVTILFDTEMLDSASTYNTGTGLWTPSTAGKYFMFAQVCFAVNAGTDWDSATIIMDKNSAGYTDTNFKNSMAHITRRSGGSSTDSFYVSQIVDLDDNDTMRIQFQGGWSGSSSNQTVGYGKTYFGGYKLA